MSDRLQLSLNLLLALEALLSEANVTRAAERIGVSQPAMSRSLQKLREQLGDDLLVRSGSGLVRTPRAERILHSLRHGLTALRRALAEEEAFEPSTSSTTFTIAANDVVGSRLLPALLEKLSREAPSVGVNVVPLDHADLAAQLQHGAADIAIGVDFPAIPGLKQRLLLSDDWICLVRIDHPDVGETLDLETFLRLPHALSSPRGEGTGVVDDALARLGLVRRIGLRTRYVIPAALAVQRTDLVLTMPRRSGERLGMLLGLRALAPPLELPELSVHALWHERMDDVPSHRWLRTSLFDACKREFGALK
jgi:DNA-binding transcriptional LysR family regulator